MNSVSKKIPPEVFWARVSADGEYFARELGGRA